ncbi:MAG: GNAT family N-acetyltransferase [Verrucomicrobiales bacterium]|nr:GNAT family N-acetyltransferase [Verrucomicrobiales bacterium]
MTVLEITPASPEYPAMQRLRDEILRKPLRLSITPEDLEAESDQRHFVLIENESVIGCALMFPVSETEAKVRQVAIAESERGRGLGVFLMEELEKTARSDGFESILLHARATAVSFYEKIGYEIVSDRFIEVTIPHFAMRKPLE